MESLHDAMTWSSRAPMLSRRPAAVMIISHQGSESISAVTLLPLRSAPPPRHPLLVCAHFRSWVSPQQNRSRSTQAHTHTHTNKHTCQHTSDICLSYDVATSHFLDQLVPGRLPLPLLPLRRVLPSLTSYTGVLGVLVDFSCVALSSSSSSRCCPPERQ